MTKHNGPSEWTSENSPLRTRKKKHDFMFIDFCSFLGLGLGIKDDFQESNFTSIAIIVNDDDRDSITLEDSTVGADSSTLFRDLLILDTTSYDETKDDGWTKYNLLKNEDDYIKVVKPISNPVISTLRMETVVKVENTEQIEEEQRDWPSKLVFLSENLVTDERTATEDEEESKTLNSCSTLRIPSSLDTKTIALPPSKNTNTCEKTSTGLRLTETKVGDTVATDRNYSNPSYTQPQNPFQIKRVPLLVDTCKDDGQSVVSFMSIEEEIFLGKGIGDASSIDRAHESKEQPIMKRFFEGKRKILRSWSWKKIRVNTNSDGQSVSKCQEPWGPVPRTKELPTLCTEASESTVVVIEPTKSIDFTTTTVDMEEDDFYKIYGNNVPFDEPQECPLGFYRSKKP